MTGRLQDIEARLLRWADARERRNPDGHGKSGTALLRDAAAELRAARTTNERLTETLDERAAMWESKALEALTASESYRGHDTEAAVTLAREANRSQNRAKELRDILALAAVPAPPEPTCVHPLREVVGTIYSDSVVRVERLSCGHKKTTFASERNAQRRRCLACPARGRDERG